MNQIRANLLGALSIVLALGLPVAAQGLTRYEMAGQAVASQFAWRLVASVSAAGSGPGQLTFDVSSLTLPDGTAFEPWNAGVPVTVQDGADTETVVLTASNCHLGAAGSCTAAADFQYPHHGRLLVSAATDGLQEAIDFLGAAGGTVVLTPDWSGGGAAIASASGGPQTSILDERQGDYAWYGWINGAYTRAAAIQPSGPGVQAREIATILYADQFPGSDAGAQINACLRALPATGGVCDARGLVPAGSNVYAAENMFAGVTAPFTLLLGPYTLNISAPQTMGTMGAIRGEGPQSLIYDLAASGTLLTVAYPQGTGLADWPMAGLYNLYVDGPGGNSHAGGPTPTIGIQIGPPSGTATGAAGFTLDHVTVRQFGSNVSLGNNAYSIRLTHDYFEDAGTALLLPAGQSNSGEMISLIDDFFADSATGIAIADQGDEVEAVNCSFDFNATAVTLTAPTIFTSVNSHWENSNLLPFITASAGQLQITGGQFLSDAGSGTWPEYILASGGADLSANGIRVDSFGSTLQAFVQWNSTGQLSLLGDTAAPAGAVQAMAGGFGPAGHGMVLDPTSQTLTVSANETVFGSARLGSEGLGATVARNGVTIGTQGSRTVLQWQTNGGSAGPYLAVDPSQPSTLAIGANGQDELTLASGGQLSDPGGQASFGSLSVGGGGALHQMLNATATLSFTSVAAQSCQEQSVPLANASANAAVVASPAASLGSSNLVWSAWISAAGQATVRLCNPTSAAITPATAAWNLWALQ